jgi:hypothetical protein
MRNSSKHILWWLIILIVAIMLMTIGIFQGGFADVLRKATLICYECIGIG